MESRKGVFRVERAAIVCCRSAEPEEHDRKNSTYTIGAWVTLSLTRSQSICRNEAPVRRRQLVKPQPELQFEPHEVGGWHVDTEQVVDSAQQPTDCTWIRKGVQSRLDHCALLQVTTA